MRRLLAGCAAVLMATSTLAAHGRAAEPEVRVNGRRLADATIVTSGGAREVFIPVAQLALAIDGPRPAASRLRVTRSGLYATSAGCCAECALCVARPVQISSRVRTIDGAPAVPLTDVVAALEARLEIDEVNQVYAIHAGKCTWCILEPR